MNTIEMKNFARTATINSLMDTLNAQDAVQFGDASFAILQVVEGQEIWTEVTVKAKSFKPTKVSPAFDPYEVAQDWQAEKAAKDADKAEKAKAKAAKIAADKARREAKAKAEAEAKTEGVE